MSEKETPGPEATQAAPALRGGPSPQPQTSPPQQPQQANLKQQQKSSPKEEERKLLERLKQIETETAKLEGEVLKRAGESKDDLKSWTKSCKILGEQMMKLCLSVDGIDVKPGPVKVQRKVLSVRLNKAMNANDANKAKAKEEPAEENDSKTEKPILENGSNNKEAEEQPKTSEKETPGAPKKAAKPERNLATMTEEEQTAYAMQMPMADLSGTGSPTEENMEVDDKEQDYSEVMNDPAFLQSVLQNLPGVSNKEAEEQPKTSEKETPGPEATQAAPALRGG